MNKFCSHFIKQTLQNSVIRNGQFGIVRLAFYASKPEGNPPPLSKNPKHKTSPRITLLSSDDKIEITTLDQAKKIAERRQLKLVSVLDFDTKTSRPLYKLMTGSEYHAEEIKKREEKKEARKEQHIKPEKLLTLNSKITQHDLESKIAKCIKWIEKLHEVRVVVSGSESEVQKTEKVVSMIEQEMAKISGRILQKRIKNGEARFSIMPTIKKEPTEVPVKPAANKKLLEQDTPAPLGAQQVRSIHTMVF